MKWFRRKKKECEHVWQRIGEGERMVEETPYGICYQPFKKEICLRCGVVRENTRGWGTYCVRWVAKTKCPGCGSYDLHTFENGCALLPDAKNPMGCHNCRLLFEG